MMKQLKLLLTICLLAAAVSGCEFGGASAAEEADAIDYYKKEIEISRDVDPSDYTDVQPVEKRIYGENGSLSAVFRFLYTDWAGSGYYLNTRTNVYEITEEGTEVLLEYYIYTYEQDDYTYLDDEGTTVEVTDYLLSRGESHKPDETLMVYYDVTYDDNYNGAPDDDYKVYTLIVDRRASDNKEITRQESTYIDVDAGAPYQIEYRTEKFYGLDKDDNLALEREFACWYDDAAPFNYLYELYHTFYSNDSTEEVYYLTQYSRDDNGDIYEQADWVYDSTAVPVVPAGGYLGSFTVAPPPFTYDINYANVGAKSTVLKTAYDTQGNFIKDERFLKGKLLEYTSYTYDRSSRLTDQSRYTQGGLILHDRITTRYSEEERDGVDYEIKVTTTFKYYDLSTDELQSKQLREDARSIARSSGLIESSKMNIYKREINNHYR